MDAQAGWAIGLTAAGVLSEGAGITTAFTEVRSRVRAMAAYTAETRKIYARANAVMARAQAHATGIVTGDPPSLEQRVEMLEGTVSGLPKAIEDAREAAVMTAVDRAKVHAEGLREDLRREQQTMADLLVGSVGGHRQVITGLVLIAAGLIAQGVGSIISSWPAKQGNRFGSSGRQLRRNPRDPSTPEPMQYGASNHSGLNRAFVGYETETFPRERRKGATPQCGRASWCGVVSATMRDPRRGGARADVPAETDPHLQPRPRARRPRDSEKHARRGRGVQSGKAHPLTGAGRFPNARL